MSTSAPHKCTVCTKDAKLICKACKNAPDGLEGLSVVYYCSATCQKDDWTAHKLPCKASKDRRALYRAGDIARRLWELFHRYAWLWPIERVERGGDMWQVFYGKRSGTSPIIPFSDALFPDDRDKKAILCHISSNAAIAYLHDAVKELLKGIYSSIEEVSVRIKNPRLIIIEQKSNALRMSSLHNVLRITLLNKEVYAFDMTAAQYGWHDSAVMP